MVFVGMSISVLEGRADTGGLEAIAGVDSPSSRGTAAVNITVAGGWRNSYRQIRFNAIYERTHIFLFMKLLHLTEVRR